MRSPLPNTAREVAMSDTSIPQKRCNVCHLEYPTTDEYWHKNRQFKDGFAYTCKQCARARERNRTHEKGEELRAKKRIYYRENRDVLVAKAVERARNNPEQARARQARYHENHPGKAAERARQWSKDNPFRVKARQSSIRAKYWNVENTLTASDLEKQFTSQDGKCWYCSIELDETWHTDHLIPMSRGGGNVPENVVCACARCNLTKQTKLPHEFNGQLL